MNTNVTPYEARTSPLPQRLGDTWPLAPNAESAPEPVFYAPGTMLGGLYRVKAVLGYGGMGVVYEAEDTELGRIVALKVPLVAEYAQAVRREAQAMAAVRHPNLAAVFAIGHHAGLDFIVMERLRGRTLEDRIDEARLKGERLGVDEALENLIAVTDALTAVHRAGLAHRDVKTSNVMLCGDRVVLTDFGLAMPELAVHMARGVAGSADYMAPEIIRTSVRPGEGPLADLYALGVVGYMMLAGIGPFEREDMTATLRAHLTEEIPDIRDVRPDVPADLAGLLKELLAKAPADRPESSESLLWRLYAARTARSSPRRASVLKVLIVDDHATVCSALQRALNFSFPGIEVETETDPERALKTAEARRFDIVLVDLHMPKMNGFELGIDLLALPPSRRPLVVAMSGVANDNDIAVLRDLGVAAFVTKDPHFVSHMCDVIGDVRRRIDETNHPPSPRPSRRDR